MTSTSGRWSSGWRWVWWHSCRHPSCACPWRVSPSRATRCTCASASSLCWPSWRGGLIWPDLDLTARLCTSLIPVRCGSRSWYSGCSFRGSARRCGCSGCCCRPSSTHSSDFERTYLPGSRLVRFPDVTAYLPANFVDFAHDYWKLCSCDLDLIEPSIPRLSLNFLCLTKYCCQWTGLTLAPSKTGFGARLWPNLSEKSALPSCSCWSTVHAATTTATSYSSRSFILFYIYNFTINFYLNFNSNYYYYLF